MNTTASSRRRRACVPCAMAIGMGLCIVAALSCAGPAQAQDRAELDKTQVIGHRELPKVLYIVPWKRPMPDALSGRPVRSVLDEALAPVDREVFRRQVDYAAQLQARAAAPRAEASATTPTAPAPPAVTTAPPSTSTPASLPAPAGAPR